MHFGPDIATFPGIRGLIRKTARAMLLVSAGLLFAAGPEPAAAWQSDISTMVRYRHETGENDIDLSAYASCSVSGLSGRIDSVRLSGWGNADLSDDPYSTDYDRLNLTEACFRVGLSEPGAGITLGRLRIGHIAGFTVDGAQAGFPLKKADLGFFAGFPVSFYSETHGDFAFGGRGFYLVRSDKQIYNKVSKIFYHFSL